MLNRPEHENEKRFELPSQTYYRTLRQFDDWWAAQGYAGRASIQYTDLSFRTRSRLLLNLLKFVAHLYEKGE